MSLDVEKIIREYITKTIHMSLATSRDNKPWVCEVHFAYDEDLNLYFRSLVSRRHCQEIADNPNVAGNIVRQHQPGEVPHGIYFEGTAALVAKDEAAQRAAFQYFIEQQGSDEKAFAASQMPDGPQIYKINVENWYAFGKFDQPSVDKYQLPWHGRG